MKIGEEPKAWLTLIFLSLIWGTSFILIKKTLIVFTPVQVALLRLAVSGIAFTPIFFVFIRRLEWHRWRFYIIIGLTGSAIPAFLYATAQTQITSASAGILNSLTPIFALIIGIWFFENKTSWRQFIGIAMGFGGASTLLLMDTTQGDSVHFMAYGLLVVAGTLFYATNVNLIKVHFQHVNSMHLSSFAFFLVGIPALFIVPFTSIPEQVVQHPEGLKALGYLVILSVISTVLALILFYKLVQQTDAVFGASVSYLIPVVAIIWGAIDGEPIGWMHFLSLIIIVSGVYLIRNKTN